MQIHKIDFENIYTFQTWHQNHINHIKTLGLEITQGVNGYCSLEAQKELKQACTKVRMPALTFLGSGNYHYLTSFLLQQIKQPFSLVLFDYHSDMQAGISDSLLSCGNWVSAALRDCPLMKQVFICGISKEYSPSVTLLSSKPVYFFTEDMIHADDWLSDFEKLCRYHVYVSIDKDVFDPAEARTNWDQGSMNRDMMQAFFDVIFEKKKLVGGDICGECSVDYSDFAYMEIQKCNDILNSYLLNLFMEQQIRENKKIG
jgi:arginase family enzyme